MTDLIKEETQSYELSERELATVLAALRYRQARLEGKVLNPAQISAIEDIASDGGQLTILSGKEIDMLAARLHAARPRGDASDLVFPDHPPKE